MLADTVKKRLALVFKVEEIFNIRCFQNFSGILNMRVGFVEVKKHFLCWNLLIPQNLLLLGKLNQPWQLLQGTLSASIWCKNS